MKYQAMRHGADVKRCRHTGLIQIDEVVVAFKKVESLKGHHVHESWHVLIFR